MTPQKKLKTYLPYALRLFRIQAGYKTSKAAALSVGGETITAGMIASWERDTTPRLLTLVSYLDRLGRTLGQLESATDALAGIDDQKRLLSLDHPRAGDLLEKIG